MDPPTLALFATCLARPFVAVFGFLTKSLPVRRIVPVGYTTFPGGIVCARHGTTNQKRFGSCSTIKTMFFHGLNNGASVDAKLVGYLLNGTFPVNVFSFKPIGVMIKLCQSIMARYISLPSVFLADPSNTFATATRTKRGRTRGLIAWLTWSTFSCLSVTAAWEVVFVKEVADVARSARKSLCRFLVRWIEPGFVAGPVMGTYGQFCFVVE